MNSESDTDGRLPVRRSRRIWAGLIGGIACALFFGEYCRVLRVVGDAYIGLLQMTVLPFIVVSLITSLGRLNRRMAGRFAVIAAAVLGLLWTLGLVGVVVLPQMFPPAPDAVFFSHADVNIPAAVDLVSLFIPANPFQSLAESQVPGIVLFSVCVGIALMNLSERDRLLEPLEVLSETLLKINGYVVKVTPVGVFALIASSLGTMSLQEIERLQVYVIAYLVGIGLFTFGLLPLVISSLTPFSYREVVRLAREALVTAFATGKTITVLPLLIDQTDQFLRHHGYPANEEQPTARTLYPLAYSFPNLGNLLTLMFIPFVAWYVGQELRAADYPIFLSTGLLTYFGKPIVAIPFLLDLMRLPADSIQLFLVSGVYVSRFGDLLSVMTLVSFTLLVAAALQGTLRLQFRRLPANLACAAALLVGSLVLPGLYFRHVLEESLRADQQLEWMQTLLNDSEAQVRRDVPAPSPALLTQPIMRRIDSTGLLRVGYNPEHLPYAFFNAHDELVGLDIDMALLLAEELNCRVKFIPVTFENMIQRLNSAEVDVVMSGVPITTDKMAQVEFSAAYLDVAWALLVRDHDRHEFRSVETILQRNDLTLVVPSDDYFRQKLVGRFPRAQFRTVRGVREYLEGRVEGDACLIDAESGAAWAMLYPSYHVVIPAGATALQPLGYAVARDQAEFAMFLSRWIDLKKKSGEFDRLYDHWILGEGVSREERRWSVIRNVLHWVD